MSSLSCKIGVGIMDEKPRSESLIKRIIHKISKHSPIFYVMVIILLTVFQFDIFKDNVPKEYIINGIIVIAIFALASNAIDKAIRKKDDPKPYLFCPECPNAKMRPTGKWICEECHQEFGKPRTE